MPEHRVELVEFRDATLDVFHGNAEFFREVELLLLRLREEFVQRRVEQANRCRQAFELAEDTFKVSALIRKQFVHCRAASFQIRCENHFANGVDTIAFKEHVFRAGKTDALRAERNGDGGLRRRVRIRAHAEARYLFAPRHQLGKVFVRRRLFGFFVPADNTENDIAGRRCNLSEEHIAGRPVNAHPFAFLNRNIADGKCAIGVIDINGGSAADADLAHLAGNECRVRRNAAARRQNTFRRNHAA